METKKGIRDIYLASGIVKLELSKATKTKAAHWIEKDFKNVIVSGFTKEEAKRQLTASTIFVSGEHKWIRKKKVKIQVIKVELKFLNKSTYY